MMNFNDDYELLDLSLPKNLDPTFSNAPKHQTFVASESFSSFLFSISSFVAEFYQELMNQHNKEVLILKCQILTLLDNICQLQLENSLLQRQVRDLQQRNHKINEDYLSTLSTFIQSELMRLFPQSQALKIAEETSGYTSVSSIRSTVDQPNRLPPAPILLQIRGTRTEKTVEDNNSKNNHRKPFLIENLLK